MVIISYRNKATRDIAIGVDSKEARKLLPSTLHESARRRLAFLAAIESTADLRSRVGLGFHSLRGNRKGQWAIWINSQYRICFVLKGKDIELVEIIDYH